MNGPNQFLGLSVQVSQSLVGFKRAFRQGNTVYVSPAMFDLIKHADPDELRTLLEQIMVLTIPDPKEMFGSLPMTTFAPKPSMFERYTRGG